MSDSPVTRRAHEKADPWFGTATRIEERRPPQITRGIAGDGIHLARTRRALDAAQQADARLLGIAGAAPERLSQFVSCALRIDDAEFDRLPLRRREADALRELREAVPRCNWREWVDPTGTADALAIHEAWEQFDGTDAGAAAFVEGVRPAADKYRRGENDVSGYFQRKAAYPIAAELYVDLLENIYRAGDGPLRLVLVGNEALAFRDAARGLIHKLVLNRGNGTAGLRAAGIFEGPLYRVKPRGAVEGGPVFHDHGKAVEIARAVSGVITELEPRLIALGSCGIPLVEQLLGSRNRFPGFVESEIVGMTPAGDLLVKQAEAKGRPLTAAAVRKWARQHGHAVLPPAFHPQLQTESLVTPVLMRDPAGEFAVALDLRPRNGKVSSDGRIEIFDPMILPLTRNEVEESTILRTAAGNCGAQ